MGLSRLWKHFCGRRNKHCLEGVLWSGEFGRGFRRTSTGTRRFTPGKEMRRKKLAVGTVVTDGTSWHAPASACWPRSHSERVLT